MVKPGAPRRIPAEERKAVVAEECLGMRPYLAAQRVAGLKRP